MYTHEVYTKMKDIFNTIILCNECNSPTEKTHIQKESFQLRAWICPKCRQQWIHPADQTEYEDFQKLRNKTFEVKLRMVGNSYAVSIPREIIDFETEVLNMQRMMNRVIRMSLESPEKLSIFFTQRTSKAFKHPSDEDDEI